MIEQQRERETVAQSQQQVLVSRAGGRFSSEGVEWQ